MAPFYHETIHRDNVAAAIDWHRQFNCDDVVPADTVFFQGGRKIEKSDLRLKEGPPWEEVSRFHYFLWDMVNHFNLGL